MGQCDGCDDCGKNLSKLQNTIASMKKKLDAIEYNTNFLSCGSSPLIALWKPSDVALFSTSTGLGSGNWAGWALANGEVYIGCDGKEVMSPNLLNRFLVGGGDGSNYSLGANGGSDTVALSNAQMPTHNHGITDPGHTHATTQDPHNHSLTQSPHDHAVTDPGHTHAMNVTEHPSFSPHSLIVETLNVDSGTGNDVPNTWSDTTDSYSVTVSADSANSNVSVNNASVSISVDEASVNLSVSSANTGVTTNNEGGGEAHENRPPYYAVIYVFKL